MQVWQCHHQECGHHLPPLLSSEQTNIEESPWIYLPSCLPVGDNSSYKDSIQSPRIPAIIVIRCSLLSTGKNTREYISKEILNTTTVVPTTKPENPLYSQL